eukprot:6202509-Pleurochrysis_carterae.AAC.1
MQHPAHADTNPSANNPKVTLLHLQRCIDAQTYDACTCQLMAGCSFVSFSPPASSLTLSLSPELPFSPHPLSLSLALRPLPLPPAPAPAKSRRRHRFQVEEAEAEGQNYE